MLRVLTSSRSLLASGARKPFAFKLKLSLRRGVQTGHGGVRWNGKEYVKTGPILRREIPAFGAFILMGLAFHMSNVRSKRKEQEREKAKDEGRATEATEIKSGGMRGRSPAPFISNSSYQSATLDSPVAPNLDSEW